MNSDNNNNPTNFSADLGEGAGAGMPYNKQPQKQPYGTAEKFDQDPKAKIKEYRRVRITYIFFFLSFMATFIPISIASVFCFMIAVCTVAAAYSMRSQADEDSLTENHMSFLISTFWRANLFFLVAGALSLLVMLLCIDYLPIQPCIRYVQNHAVSVLTNIDLLQSVVKKCKAGFMRENEAVILITSLIAFLPILGYLVFRALQGWTFLQKSQLIPSKNL